MSHGSSRLSPQDLLQALEQRDGALLAAHSLRWAHRHGVEALESLIQGQVLDETARLWWREQLVRPAPATVVATEALHGSRPAGGATISPVREQLTPPVLEDSVPLPAEWLVPVGLDQQVVPESESEPMDVAVVEPAAFESVAFDQAAPEPAVALATEPLPPLAEAFGPIPGLEPLPSFNVQAIFTMQSELAEKPLAPPIVPPLMAPPAELQLEAFPPVEAQSLPESQPQLQEEAPTEAFAIPVDPTQADAAPGKPAGPRRNPLSRLRGLFRDCVEEVASTFGNEEEEEEESFMALEPAAASAETPRLSGYQAVPEALTPPDALVDSFPAQQPASRGPIAPPPFALQQPPQPTRQAQRRGRGESGSAAGRGTRANRPSSASPAPAPSHPALDSLRSWLPDSLEQDDHRQAS